MLLFLFLIFYYSEITDIVNYNLINKNLVSLIESKRKHAESDADSDAESHLLTTPELSNMCDKIIEFIQDVAYYRTVNEEEIEGFTNLLVPLQKYFASDKIDPENTCVRNSHFSNIYILI